MRGLTKASKWLAGGDRNVLPHFRQPVLRKRGLPCPRRAPYLPRMSKVLVTRILTCTAPEIEAVLSVIPDYLQRTRAHAGCLEADVWQDDLTPTLFHLHEVYRDAAARAAQRDWAERSDWGRITAHMAQLPEHDGDV